MKRRVCLGLLAHPLSVIKDYLSIEHPYCSLWVQIQIKYEIALSRVHFANIYKVVAIKYLEKQI